MDIAESDIDRRRPDALRSGIAPYPGEKTRKIAFRRRREEVPPAVEPLRLERAAVEVKRQLSSQHQGRDRQCSPQQDTEKPAQRRRRDHCEDDPGDYLQRMSSRYAVPEDHNQCGDAAGEHSHARSGCQAPDQDWHRAGWRDNHKILFSLIVLEEWLRTF